ncbi:MAG TPA: hypothetical protein PLS03_00505, partial [Terrimicrobiaceae bacterium]|nr:hypothetical protein [Terrimicrobiaceae bacterium]
MRAKLRQLIQDRQLQSIAARPRHQSGSAAIGHDHFEYVDALSFSVSYQEIFLNRAYHFLSGSRHIFEVAKAHQMLPT